MRPCSTTIVPLSEPDPSERVPLFLLKARICRMSANGKSPRSPLSSIIWSSSSQQTHNHLSELNHGDWLRQISGRAKVHAGLDILFGAFRADNDDGQMLIVHFGSYLANELKAVHIGHSDVRQHQVIFSTLDFVERVLAIDRLSYIRFANSFYSC